jgi:hypothetical protein
MNDTFFVEAEMFDWLRDLIDEILDDEDDEVRKPELPPVRLPSPNYTPKLRIRLDKKRPYGLGGQHGTGRRYTTFPQRKPTVPPSWHPSYPGNWHKKINQQHRMNRFHNPNSSQNWNHPMNIHNPNSFINRSHRNLGHNGPPNSMNPFGPNHRR